MTRNKLTHPGNILLIGFGGLLIMMGVLVYLSIKQDIPMVSKNYYEQELEYQDKLDAMNNADAYDKQFTLTIAENKVLIQLPQALSGSIQQGTAYFYCPANEAMDHTVQLAASGNGLYTFSRSELRAESYIVKLSFVAGEKSYYKEMPLQW